MLRSGEIHREPQYIPPCLFQQFAQEMFWQKRRFLHTEMILMWVLIITHVIGSIINQILMVKGIFAPKLRMPFIKRLLLREEPFPLSVILLVQTTA